MSHTPLRLLIIGAHPDDADLYAGGTAALYRAAGHSVKMVSLTNGDAGHQTLRGPELATRRRAEATAAGRVIGATYDVFSNPDGGLEATLENRLQIIRLIRLYQPDLVLTHRPWDYHPDHRYTSQLVQDAAYMVTVPAVAPDVPHLADNPVIAYLPDHFRRPYPFDPAVVVDVGGVLDTIVAMLDCHTSQFYEWLPFNTRRLEEVPPSAGARKEWLTVFLKDRLRKQTEVFRPTFGKFCTPDRAAGLEFVEAFEACEYGSPLDDHARRRLFPFAE